MVNLWKTIGKLQQFQETMNGRQSLPSQLEEIAVFVRTDLPELISDLIQQQADDDSREMDLSAELRAEQARYKFELEKSIEERATA